MNEQQSEAGSGMYAIPPPAQACIESISRFQTIPYLVHFSF
ncbi:hypothetical protein J2T17_005664 [Paenibacillus mucilaginosus]